MAVRLFLTLGFGLALATLGAGHMLVTWPPQRGCLWGNKFEPNPKVADRDAPHDYLPHFPAGDRNSKPGSALESQKREAGPAGWTPFEPEKPGFRWRSGVCGDLKSKPEHLRGGKYYFNGKPSDTYEQGGILSLDITVVTHHNGFLELRLCNPATTGGEISEATFKSGGCKILKRVVDPSCESRTDKMCAPINPDPRYAHRWDFPCRSSESGRSYYGKGKIRYHLPEGWAGPHFVLHMYHTAANDCMPLGITDFFEGPRGPQWGNCKGQGGAVGGYRRYPALCGGSKFPEEYYKCADIAITPRAAGPAPPIETPVSVPDPTPVTSSAPPMPTYSPMPSTPAREPVTGTPMPASPTPAMPTPVMPVPALPTSPEPSPMPIDTRPPTSVGPLTKLVLVGDGRQSTPFGNGDDIVIDVTAVQRMTFQMQTVGTAPGMVWAIDGTPVWTEYSAPYYLGGNTGPVPKYFKLPVNRKFVLKVSSGTSVMTASVTLIKN